MPRTVEEQREECNLKHEWDFEYDLRALGFTRHHAHIRQRKVQLLFLCSYEYVLSVKARRTNRLVH